VKVTWGKGTGKVTVEVLLKEKKKMKEEVGSMRGVRSAHPEAHRKRLGEEKK